MSEQSDGPGQPGNQFNKRLAFHPKVVAGIVIAVLALVFVFQNTGEGRIDILFWSVSMPTWIWLLVIFVAGVAVGSLFPWMRRRRHG